MDKKVYDEKVQKCIGFIMNVAELCSNYTLIGSCNQDISRYLIPNGTESDLSYYGKPAYSLRFSDHWNWLSSLKKCSDEHYVQCRSLDMPWCRKRIEPGKASKPRFGIQVAFYDKNDGCYHHVYGDKFDRKTKTWSWVEMKPGDVVKMMQQA